MKKWFTRTVVACTALSLVVFSIFLVNHWFNGEPKYQGRALSEWLVELHHSNPKVRLEAMGAIRAMGAEAVPALTNELLRPPTGIQRAVHATSQRVPNRVQRWLGRIYNPSVEIAQKHVALQAIGLLGTNGTVAVPAVSKIFREPNVGLSSAAGAALANLGTNALPALIPALDDGDSNIRWNACHALSQLREDAAPAVPRLERIVLEERGSIVNMALITLTAIGAPAVPCLANLLTNPDPTIQAPAMRALGQIGLEAKGALPALIGLLKVDDETIRAAAIQSIAAMDWTSKETGEVLLKSLDDRSALVREVAAEGLKHRPQLVRFHLEKLCELLSDESGQVREAAATTVGQTGEHGLVALPYLRILANDTNVAVRLSAERALESITRSSELAQRNGGSRPLQLQERSF